MPNAEASPSIAATISQILPAAAVGETIVIGDRTFTRDTLRADAEDALTNVVIGLVKSAPEQELGAMFLASLRECRRAAAIILADLQGGDPDGLPQAIEETEAWIATTRGVTNAALVDLVLSQINLQGVGQLLGRLFSVAVATGVVSGGADEPAADSSAS